MFIHKFLYSVLCIGIIIQLTGCERPASTAPQQINTPVKINPTPTSNPAQIVIAQTQTAIAIKRTSRVSVSTTAKTIEKKATTTETVPGIVVTVTPTLENPVSPTPPGIPTLSRPVTYTLQSHEDPYCIARRYDLDIGELLSQNNLTTDSKPQEGLTLIIPSTNHRWNSGARALMYHPTSYAVRSGDTLAQIACMFGDVSPEAIITVNGLVEPYVLTAGQILEIP